VTWSPEHGFGLDAAQDEHAGADDTDGDAPVSGGAR
jgi:hypothetical protein